MRACVRARLCVCFYYPGFVLHVLGYNETYTVYCTVLYVMLEGLLCLTSAIFHLQTVTEALSGFSLGTNVIKGLQGAPDRFF